jgi:hypothetical protein
MQNVTMFYSGAFTVLITQSKIKSKGTALQACQFSLQYLNV